MSQYHLVTALIAPKALYREDLKTLALDHFECQGVEEYNFDESQVDEILGEGAIGAGAVADETYEKVESSFNNGDQMRLKFYFISSDLAQGFSEQLASLDISFENESCEVQDWNAEWKKHYKKIEVSPALMIVPSWEKPKTGPLPSNQVYIEPGMGFGTGDHETTFQCLQFLEQLEAPATCLDYGTGSGILGIAAYKLGAEQVDLYDIDSQALQNAKHNVRLNIEKQSHEELFGIYPLAQRGQLAESYQIVLANILWEVLESEASVLRDFTQIGGHLILSGLLHEQVEKAKVHFLLQRGLEFLAQSSKGDWAGILFKRVADS